MNRIKEIIFLAKSIYFSIYYFFLVRIVKIKKGTNENSNFIISLTSYHKRLNYLHYVIYTLLKQKLKPKKIHLYLSNEDIKKAGGIPKSLLKYCSYGLEIIVKDENVKSYKKLIYAYYDIKKYDDINFIITADDDIFYPKYWSLKLLDKSIKDNVVSCFRGHNLQLVDGLCDYNLSMKINSSNSTPSYNLLPTGCSGVAYPVNSLNENLLDYNFLKYSPDGDDIWFKAVTLSQKYKSARVMDKNIHFPILIQSLGHGLYSSNVMKSQNNIKITDTFNYFMDKGINIYDLCFYD